MNKKNERNCTITENSPCGNCKSKGKLLCKFSKKSLHAFMKIGFPPVIFSLIGLGIANFNTGQWWMIITYAIFTFGMLGAIEMIFLCRHCPYYAEEGKTIICIGNYGSLKLFPYDPAPMNSFERFMMIFFVTAAFFILPLSGMVYSLFTIGTANSILFITISIIALLNLVSSINFIKVLFRDICSKCINFSCPLNKVSKDVVDDYLNKNTVMREAWEKTGYKLG